MKVIKAITLLAIVGNFSTAFACGITATSGTATTPSEDATVRLAADVTGQSQATSPGATVAPSTNSSAQGEHTPTE